MTVSLRDHLAEKLGKVELISTKGVAETLRQVKDKDEIVQIFGRRSGTLRRHL